VSTSTIPFSFTAIPKRTRSRQIALPNEAPQRPSGIAPGPRAKKIDPTETYTDFVDEYRIVAEVREDASWPGAFSCGGEIDRRTEIVAAEVVNTAAG
jgi:hypothetical protein